MKKIRHYLALLPALIGLAVLTNACGDDVTNHYYPQEPVTPPAEEEKPQEPSFEEGEWITKILPLCYMGIMETYRDCLFPAWLLQADGVRQAYPDSEFVQEFINSGMYIKLRNPGAGTRITLRMDESPVSHASEQSITVPQEETDETLILTCPVEWNVDALLGWHTDKTVRLGWKLFLDGKEVEYRKKTFNCRSLHCYTTNLYYNKKDFPDEVAYFKQFDPGSYPVKEDDTELNIYFSPFLMGYIDEHSPMVEKLKNEVISDGYLPYLTGAASPSIKDQLDCTARAFVYLMMKHCVAYSTSNSSGPQYMRTIDDIFRNQQGYCMELAIAFASWCMNLGVGCTLEGVPGHAVNRIYGIDGKLYPVDMTQVTKQWGKYQPFATPPTQADFEQADALYNLIMELSAQKNDNIYEPGRNDTPAQYNTTATDPLRHWLPSFNIGESYAHTRAALAPEKGLRIVKRPWLIN